ncbi:MAG: aminotransferase class IV [Alkalispirochaeta sp.]
MSEIVELRGARRVSREAFGRTLADLAADEPANGVYLVARTYRAGLVLDLDSHFDRVERSAAALGTEVSIPRTEIREVLEMLRRPVGDIRFRVTAVLDDPVWYRISCEPAQELPEEIRRDGVVCAIRRGEARANATVKSTRWIHRRRDFNQAGIYEYLLTNEAGEILEGGSSNFYAVIDGRLRTAGEGVLEGIARRRILDLAPTILPVVRTPATIEDVQEGRIAECFISSATRGIVPVREIRLDAGDGDAGDGDREMNSRNFGPSGPVTRGLIDAWERHLDTALEPLVPVRG